MLKTNENLNLMKLRTFPILLIIAGSLFSCEFLEEFLDSEIPTIELVQVTGNITEIASDVPISGATVTIVDQPDIAPVLTGTNGQFSITNLRLDDDTYRMEATHPDYTSQSTVFTIEGGTLRDTINLAMVPTGGIQLSLQVLDFGAREEQASLSVRNTSNATRNLGISFDIPWLQVNESTISIEAGQSRSVAFTVDRSAVNIGSYEGTVSLSVPGIPAQQLTVKMQKLDPNAPILVLDASSIDFDAGTTSQNLTITNEGLSTLNWSVTASESWVSISSPGGSVEPSQNTSLEIIVSRDGFVTNGDYSATLDFSGNGGTATVTVNVSVEGLSGGPNEDDDNDGIINSVDADDDNDGLIDINTLDDLNNIRNDLTAAGTGLVGAPAGGFTGYELTRNLDFDNDASYEDVSLKSGFTSGSGWVPIGVSNNAFNTVFEGNGFTISNLFINRTTSHSALFAYTETLSEIKNLNVAIRFLSGASRSAGLIGFNEGNVMGCSVKGDITSAGSSGLLVGEMRQGTINDSYAEGNITSSGTNAGGLIGDIQTFSGDNVEVVKSYADVKVTGLGRIGGFIGEITASGDAVVTVNTCYALGDVNAQDLYAGGFVGLSIGTISNSYARGDVTSTSSRVGGFVGQNNGSITSCFSTGKVAGSNTIGGFSGRNLESVTTDNYWDTTTSGISESSGGTGLTTVQLQGVTSNVSIYATWSADAWDFGTATQYPALKGMPNGLEAQR